MKTHVQAAPSATLLTQILRSPVARVVIGALFVLAGVILTQVVVQLLGLISPAGTALTNGLATGVALLAVAAGYSAYVRIIEHRPVVELAAAPAPGELAAGAALSLALLTAVVGLLTLLGFYQVTGLTDWPVLVNAVARNVPSAFIQDIVLLGLVFRLARQALGTWPALGIATGLFGLLHLLSPQVTAAGLGAATLAGLLLIAAFLRTGHLWLAAGIHAMWDVAADGLFGVGVSGTTGAPVPGLLQAHLSGPALLTGGAFGVQASILVSAGLLLAAGALLWSAQRQGLTGPGRKDGAGE